MRTRSIIGLAALVSAAVHFRLWTTGVRHEHVVGPAFLINAVAGLVIAGLLVTWRHRAPLFLAFGFGVSTFGAFVIASTAGLFGDHETWSGGYVWVAAISEVLAVVLALVAATQEGYLAGATDTSSRRLQPWRLRQLPHARQPR
jgi:hypothetical protein